LPQILDSIPLNCESLVDLGCGRGIIGALCRIYRAPERMVGVDGFAPYLDFCGAMGFYDELLSLDLRQMPLPFPSAHFQVATCIEVIEHLPKDQGLILLSELERIASCVIVTTPGIWFEQDDYDGNPLQKHLALWTVGEFTKRDYRVYGVGAFKVGYQIRRVLRRIIGTSGLSIVERGMRAPARRLSEGLGPLTRAWPQLSTKLLCVKAEPDSLEQKARSDRRPAVYASNR